MSDESFLCQIMFLQTHTDHPTKSKAAIPWLWHLSVWGLGHLSPLPLIHGGWQAGVWEIAIEGKKDYSKVRAGNLE